MWVYGQESVLRRSEKLDRKGVRDQVARDHKG